MADFKDFFLGIILWLGSGTFLLTFFNRNLNNDSRFSENAEIVSSTLDETNQALTEAVARLHQEKKDKEEQLADSQAALSDAEERIRALELQLDQISDELELSQNQYYRLEKTSQRQGDELNQKMMELNQRYQNLQANYESLPTKLSQDWQKKILTEINSLLVDYPTAKMMVKLKPDLPAKSIISLLRPLEGLLSLWNIKPMGKPWQKVNFDPNLHQSDDDSIKVNDLVYIRFVGYMQGETILVKAKVSRHLPGQKYS